jgi:hypothetical protein
MRNQGGGSKIEVVMKNSDYNLNKKEEERI